METGVLVAIIAASASIIGGIVSGAFSLLLNHAKHKDERQDRKEDARTDWEKHVDECLDADKRAIRRLEKAADDANEMDKLLLRGLMLITAHLVDRNHTKELQEYAEEVKQKLIERI